MFIGISRLAEFSGLEANFKPFQGTYSATSVEPRDLPSDALIVECWQQIRNPGWRWVFGMLATFGLRDHEPFYLDVDELDKGKHLVAVMKGKTGKRLVWACYPEWVDQFNLRERQLPSVTGKEHEDFTQRVCKFFGREKFPSLLSICGTVGQSGRWNLAYPTSWQLNRWDTRRRCMNAPITDGSRLTLINGLMMR